MLRQVVLLHFCYKEERLHIQDSVYQSILMSLLYCNLTPETDAVDLVKESSLIIWDEAPMMSRHCFESLDRSLADIMRSAEKKPFAGKIVFGGDFRQILPVIHSVSRAEIVLESLNSSYLWKHCKVLKLTKNMRLLSTDMTAEELRELEVFLQWILDVGDGLVGDANDGDALITIYTSLYLFFHIIIQHLPSFISHNSFSF